MASGVSQPVLKFTVAELVGSARDRRAHHSHVIPHPQICPCRERKRESDREPEREPKRAPEGERAHRPEREPEGETIDEPVRTVCTNDVSRSYSLWRWIVEPEREPEREPQRRDLRGRRCLLRKLTSALVIAE